ncbi:M23 family metallopeptidase [Marinicrinis lubricantis]|uniref:LysM peptidoglycan-binding domain-containing protein n=1 Tax=Marinicrinis lubricantis TaxID=2086470 RepID=A0ABW1IKE3_9BACL
MVKPGDTLWKISLAYGVTVNQLKQWNSLPSDMIYVGQHLATSDPYYTVKAGDSLYSIANKTESTIQGIKQANNLTSNALTLGQRLYIPPQPSVAQPNMFSEGIFPLIDKTYDAFTNTYGDARSYAAGETSRVHEGNDIMAKSWVPIFSVEDGVVVRYGWSELGGWRLTVKASNGIAFYYAHMSGYANGIKNGATVKKGQLIGYVGSTGYGPQGTSGKFLPHLHFTMYDTNVNPWKSMDPYLYLKWWENR